MEAPQVIEIKQFASSPQCFGELGELPNRRQFAVSPTLMNGGRRLTRRMGLFEMRILLNFPTSPEERKPT